MKKTAEQQVNAELRRAWMTLPASRSVDVLVVGGGPAGCAAAIAAARHGAKVLLVERFGFLGGMATAALVPAFCPFTDQVKPIVRGIGLEILQNMKSRMPHVPVEQFDWVPIDPEALKEVYEDYVLEAGGQILYLTQFVDVQTPERGRVGSIIVHNKSGLQRIEGRVVVDCTGDADVVAAAGGPFAKGDPETGRLQPVTLCFVLAGIDNRRFQQWLWADESRNLLLKPAIARAKAAGDLDIPEEAANVAYQSESTIGVNFGHVFDVDGTDAEQQSRAQVEARRQVRRLVAFFRKYCPGCERAFLVSTGVQIGVRETRRIVGDYTLTLDDYLARRSFEDEIARNAYYIDIHLSNDEMARDRERGRDTDERLHRYGPGESHGIPYRCLLPRSLDNVLVAGRCISTDRPVQGSTRVMPVCLATGEAAGVAAAMAATRNSGDVRRIDVSEVRKCIGLPP